jgi:hypothetical protein
MGSAEGGGLDDVPATGVDGFPCGVEALLPFLPDNRCPPSKKFEDVGFAPVAAAVDDGAMDE